MANEKKTQDPTVEFILRTANAEPEESMRALVTEMLEHTAEPYEPAPGDLPASAADPSTTVSGTNDGYEAAGGNSLAIESIMNMLKSHGGDIATLAAPLVGAGIAGRGNRLRGAGIGAGVGLGVNAAATAAEAPGFSVGLQVLARLAKAMGGERKSLPHPADYKGADTIHTSGGPLELGETPPSASTLGEYLNPTS